MLCICFSLLQCVCVVPFAVSESESSHEDAGRDRGKFVSGGCRGGDPCNFSSPTRAERAEPFAEGLALGVIFDRRQPRRKCARAGLRRPHVLGDRVGSICDNRMGRFCGDRTGSVSGDRMGSVSGDRVGRLICYTETRSTR